LLSQVHLLPEPVTQTISAVAVDEPA